MPKKVSLEKIKKFRKQVWRYYHDHGRQMPWRPPLLTLRKDKTVDPYKILVSEIMLQQTQVDRVVPRYAQFLKTFPTIRSLADVPLRDVLAVWQGLGYNRRAKYLHECAKVVVRDHGGLLPADREALKALPGIGDGTSGSLCAFAFNLPVAFIETNIRRTYLHFFFPRSKEVDDKKIITLVRETVDRKNPREWYYALMDYGTMLGKTVPKNPNIRSAHYVRQSKFEGSNRQVRGAILKALVAVRVVPGKKFPKLLLMPVARVRPALSGLVAEGLVRKQKHGFSLV